MKRLMWLAFFCHIVFFVCTHGGVEWLKRRVESGDTGFEFAHDRALNNAHRRAEQLAHRETEVGRRVSAMNDKARILRMMDNEARR